MKPLYLLFLLTVLFQKGVCQQQTTLAYSKELDPYVEFLEKPHLQPKEYILSLFNKYDIVIISEGHHGEIFQYDLLFDVISDKRFIEKVGNVFTEVGLVNKTEEANAFIHSSYSPARMDSILAALYRNLDWIPLWEKHNFYDYLKRIYLLNQRLPQNNKINIYFTDMPFLWDTITTSTQYEKFEASMNKRDSIMAANVIAEFEKIKTSKRPKALVIWNRPHSIIKPFTCNAKLAGHYVQEKYNSKVTTVLLNTVVFNDDFPAMANGKWDAAFYIKGFPEVGFEFLNSPFGKDVFDMFPFCIDTLNPIKILYENVFDSYVYYKSPIDQVCTYGIPEVIDSSFVLEMIRRQDITNFNRWKKFSKNERIEDIFQYYGKLHYHTLFDNDTKKKYLQNVNKWFHDK